ncbi:hypothetical protein [Streptomyces olivaceiscleroticus]|uniref:MarR family transcriptional regulator n=1 Tax=Streptomyces olivaceiscleroticus TaxID=68245 RepID=A0ABN1A3X8_9ACTN
MRLSTPRTAARRTWTVELQPRPEGPALACPQCIPLPRPLPAGTARATALAHLARHARESTLPAHLRTCQCQARGCRWHTRHRGCAGTVQLVLTRDRGGRRWRLTDACTACAAATERAAVVPDTLPAAPSPTSPHRRPPHLDPCRREEQAHARVREMLTYLGAALPRFCSPTARLLALQCALRANRCGQVHLPGGLLRGMRLAGHAASWHELTHANWLAGPSPRTARGGVAVQLLDAAVRAQAPGRAQRARASHWALQPTHLATTHDAPPALQLTALALASHTTTASGRAEISRLTRMCGLSPGHLQDLLDRLLRLGLLTAWSRDLDNGEELNWQLPSAAGHVGAGSSSTRTQRA